MYFHTFPYTCCPVIRQVDRMHRLTLQSRHPACGFRVIVEDRLQRGQTATILRDVAAYKPIQTLLMLRCDYSPMPQSCYLKAALRLVCVQTSLLYFLLVRRVVQRCSCCIVWSQAWLRNTSIVCNFVNQTAETSKRHRPAAHLWSQLPMLAASPSIVVSAQHPISSLLQSAYSPKHNMCLCKLTTRLSSFRSPVLSVLQSLWACKLAGQ